MIIHSTKKIHLFKRYIWFIINAGLVLPLKIVMAQGSCPPCPPNAICNPLAACSFNALITSLANIAFAIGFPIAIMFILWSGFLFVSARGNEEQIKTAKKTFTWAIIGTAILLGAKVIAVGIQNTMLSL